MSAAAAIIVALAHPPTSSAQAAADQQRDRNFARFGQLVCVLPEEPPIAGDVLKIEEQRGDSLFFAYYRPLYGDTLPAWQAVVLPADSPDFEGVDFLYSSMNAAYKVDTANYPEWQQADAELGADQRMTDSWCDIARP